MSKNLSGKKQKNNILHISLFLFFVSSPMESVSIWEGFSVSKLSAIIVILAWMIKGFPLPKSKMMNAFYGLLGYSILTIIWSINRANTINQIIMFLIPSLVVSLAMLASIRSKEDIIFYLKGYIVGCLVTAVSGIYNRDAMLSQALYTERITALGADQNALAFLLIMGVACLLSYYATETIKWKRIISIIAMGVFAVMILSTGSRTGLILMGTVIGGFFLTQTKRNFGSSFIFGILIIVAAPFIVRYIPDSIWDRFAETNQLVSNGDFSDRGNVWEMGLNSLKQENFVLGVGYSNFKIMIIRYYGEAWASHNTYLSYFSEFGFVGFLVFLYVVYIICQYAYKIAKEFGYKFIYFYIFPFLLIMFTLETEYKRWIFIIGILLESWYYLSKKESAIKYENTTINPYLR